MTAHVLLQGRHLQQRRTAWHGTLRTHGHGCPHPSCRPPSGPANPLVRGPAHSRHANTAAAVPGTPPGSTAPRDHCQGRYRRQAQAGRLERRIPAQGPVKLACDCPAPRTRFSDSYWPQWHTQASDAQGRVRSLAHLPRNWAAPRVPASQSHQAFGTGSVLDKGICTRFRTIKRLVLNPHIVPYRCPVLGHAEPEMAANWGRTAPDPKTVRAHPTRQEAVGPPMKPMVSTLPYLKICTDKLAKPHRRMVR